LQKQEKLPAAVPLHGQLFLKILLLHIQAVLVLLQAVARLFGNFGLKIQQVKIISRPLTFSLRLNQRAIKGFLIGLETTI
jgi:hypothetical protein